MEKGLLIVLSGPSGVGKGTVCSALRKKTTDLTYSISVTTRKPRMGEAEGVNYFFRSREQFEEMIHQGELLEYAEYVGNYYGTPASFVQQSLEAGKDVLLEIEVQGALKVKERFPDGIFVFLTPPSISELRSRIVGRGTETKDTIAKRMDTAVEELALIKHYDYAVENDQIDAACARIMSIITAEHCRKERVMPYLTKWIEEVR